MRYPFIIIGSVALALGCSTASGDIEESPGSVSEVAEPLSNHEHCDTAPADATISGFRDTSVTSSRSYSHPESCNNGFMVDVFIENGLLFTGTVKWADGEPTNADECGRARILSYVWDKGSSGDPNAPGTFLGGPEAVGDWQNQRCVVPSLVSPNGILQAHHTYRYAISARQENASGYARRAVSLTTKFAGIGGASP